MAVRMMCPAAIIGSMLQDEDSLRLVVLNSCEGARTSHVDPFSGLATSLVEFDIPAVVGMQFEISDEAAVAFAGALYRALAQGLPIDAAMGPARRAIIAAGRRAEFGTPVLFLRGSNARLFDIQGQATPGQRGRAEGDPSGTRASSDHRWPNALAAFVTRRWQEAAEALEALGEDYPHDEDVRVKLAEARRQLDMATLSENATEAAERGDWSHAVSSLEQLLALDPTVDSARERLEQARTVQRSQSLLQDLRAVAHAGQWDTVLIVANELAQLDPELADPDGLATQARARIRHDELAKRYSDALSHLDHHEWREALSTLSALSREAPGFREREVRSLLTVASEHAQPSQKYSSPVGERQSGEDEQGRPSTEPESRDALSAMYGRGEDALARGDLDVALRALSSVEKRAPGYRDLARLLKQVRQALEERSRLQQVKDLTRVLHFRYEQRDWRGVLATADEIAIIDPSAADPDGITSKARLALQRQDEHHGELESPETASSVALVNQVPKAQAAIADGRPEKAARIIAKATGSSMAQARDAVKGFSATRSTPPSRTPHESLVDRAPSARALIADGKPIAAMHLIVGATNCSIAEAKAAVERETGVAGEPQDWDYSGVIAGLGGVRNILGIEPYYTGIVVDVAKQGRVNRERLKSSGVSGIATPGRRSVQLTMVADPRATCERLQARLMALATGQADGRQ